MELVVFVFCYLKHLMFQMLVCYGCCVFRVLILLSIVTFMNIFLDKVIFTNIYRGPLQTFE